MKIGNKYLRIGKDQTQGSLGIGNFNDKHFWDARVYNGNNIYKWKIFKIKETNKSKIIKIIDIIRDSITKVEYVLKYYNKYKGIDGNKYLQHK